MYPATIFNWIDQSAINSNNNATPIDDAPLFMQVFSSDKGTEDLIEISGTDFTAMYGTMSFDRHGQSAIQAKNIIDAGGKLLAKRVVAEDSTLGNVVLCATVTEVNNGVSVKWTSHSVQNCKTFDDVKSAAEDMLDETSGTYPLIVYADNGRGVSGKAVKLTPDYATSKTAGTSFYTLNVLEGTASKEKKSISINPNVVYNDNSYRFDKYATVQITGCVIEGVWDLYTAKLAEALNIDLATIKTYDVVYGYTNRGSVIPGFELDAESVDLDADNGVALAEGSNGEFGDAPVGTEAWAKAIADVFLGKTTDEVWNVDTHKIAAVLDANYPMVVKNAIFAFVTFRKDCVYLRDYGLGLDTYLEIKQAHDVFDEEIVIDDMAYANQRNCFVADYFTSYQIKDPSTKKNIEVTMLYDMASVLVNHIANNPYAPVAGSINGFILANAIKGTINFVPVHTPKVNQLEAIDELRVNYAIFNDDQCVVQSAYTSQDKYTQLSYLNNVIAVQRVLRAVRTACPRQRYSLATANDLSNYAQAVNSVLANYITNFAVLEFEYVEDSLRAAQKIFYAAIRFAFNNWAQTEIFDIFIVNNDSTTNG